MPNKSLYDELEYTTSGIYVLNGIPFSGIAYENDSAGRLVCEAFFVEGKNHGPARDYYCDGTLKREAPYSEGRKHGVERAWFLGGRIKAEKVFEFGALMKSKEWDINGGLEKEYTRSVDDYLYQQVVKERSKANC